jgi:transposase
MRKIKEVLRLRNELNLDQRQIARCCSISVSTVHEYLKRAAAAHLVWPLTDGWDDARLEAVLFPCPDTPQPPTTRSLPDFAAIHEQLQRHRDVTLQLVWEEYRDGNPDGYGYSRFCELYHRWRKKLDVVLRQEHKAGEKAFVDWAGATMPIYERGTGEVWQAPMFVAALGASSYTWAEVTHDQQMEAWLLAHTHALEFWGGVPRLIVPDNTRTGVSKSCRYDPDVNPTYQNFAAHYGFGVLPARPYKPRDKAVVENAVQVAQRWIVAALRQRKFFSLAEANQAIGELLHRINHRPFRKRDGSRASVFAELDKPALQPLPKERFEIADWARARVNIDYHVAFDGNFYSVPYNLVQEAVEVRATAATVEILHHSGRVASHVRNRGRGNAITLDAHRPKSHQAHLKWPPSRMVEWAEKIGPHTARLFEKILADKPHPEMGYRGCLGIIRLAEKYSALRMEAAAERALLTGACRYRSVASILKNSLDRQPLPAAAPSTTPSPHDNVRGAEYFE